MNNFRELVVWKKSVDFAVKTYEVTTNFPDRERYNLINQLQRASVSIASSIAEGAGRNSKPLFKQFLSIAQGLAYEIETQLLICKKLNYIEEETHNALNSNITEIQRMLFGLINTL